MIIKDSRRKDIENKTIFAHANKTGYIFKRAETADMPDKHRKIEIMGIVNITVKNTGTDRQNARRRR